MFAPEVAEDMPIPPGVMPPSGDLDEREEAEKLRRAIAHFRAAPGPFMAHRFFGRLTRDEWHRLQLIHMAHHLSFARYAIGNS